MSAIERRGSPKHRKLENCRSGRASRLKLRGERLDTLALLIQNRGRLLDKDELLSKVWPGTIVEEANLTQSIFTLRKILGDSPKDHRYIITVPGRGYQFVGAVTETNNGGTTSGSRPRVRRPLWIGAGAIVLVAAFFGVWLSARSRNSAIQPLEPIPFTTSLGSAAKPAFSPDRNEIAYSWSPEDRSSQSIYVKIIGSETELRLTNGPGRDSFPAWSPDGRQIAFYRSLEGESGYYTVSALGGSVRCVLRSTPIIGGVAWFPDGERLAVLAGGAQETPAAVSRIPDAGPAWFRRHRDRRTDPFALVSIDIESRERKALTSPPPHIFGDLNPAFSPDGAMLAFTRETGGDLSEIYVEELMTGRMRQLTNVRGFIDGLAWTPDSREIVYDLTHNIGAQLWRVGMREGAARPITSGVANVSSPAIAREGSRLAYEVNTGYASLWRAAVSGPDLTSAGMPTRLISSIRETSEPAYSPDGRKLAFISDRSGSIQIWASDTDGRNLVQLTSFAGSNNGSPRWSWDGSEVAFDSRQGGNSEIYVVQAAGSKPRRITDHPGEDVVPSWSKDGRWIYFASKRSGDFQVWKVPAASGESSSTPAVQVTQGGGFNAVESADGEYLYYSKGRDKRGLWRRPLEPGAESREEPVLDSLQHWGWWALSPAGVFFLEKADVPFTAKAQLKFLDLKSKQITELRTLEDPVRDCAGVMTASPDGRFVVFEQNEHIGSNIMLVENFR